jgi:hypothetical protein
MKNLVIFFLLAIVGLLASCQKNSEIEANATTTFVVLVGDNNPETIVYMDNLAGEGPHDIFITDQQWEVVKNCQEIYISWQKFSKDESIYVDDGFIDIKGKDGPIVIP